MRVRRPRKVREYLRKLGCVYWPNYHSWIRVEDGIIGRTVVEHKFDPTWGDVWSELGGQMLTDALEFIDTRSVSRG